MNRKKHRHFLVFKGLETSCVRNRGEGSVYNHLLQTNGSGVRGVDPRMSMKNLNLLSIKWVVGVGACGQWVWFPFCVRRHVPLVHRELFWGEGALVVKKKTGRRLLSDHHTGANCDERWHKSSTDALGGKNNVDTKTWKSNGTLLAQLQHSPYTFFFLLLLLEPIVVRM